MTSKETAARVFFGIPYVIGTAIFMFTLACCVILGGPEIVLLLATKMLSFGEDYPVPIYGGVVLLVAWYCFADRYFKQQRKKKAAQKWAEKRQNRPL